MSAKNRLLMRVEVELRELKSDDMRDGENFALVIVASGDEAGLTTKEFEKYFSNSSSLVESPEAEA